MPDGTTLEVPKPTSIELAAMGHKEVVKTALKPEQIPAFEEAKKRQAENRGKDGFKELAGATTETRFTPLQATALQEKFGGGKAKYDEDGRKVTLPIEEGKRATLEEEASFKSAQETITQLANYLSYFEILSTIDSAGNLDKAIEAKKDITGIKTKDGAGGYNEIREGALKFILNNSGSLFQEIAVDADGNKLTGNALLNYVEQTFANDPIFRNKIAAGLKRTADEAQNLPDVSKDDEVKNAEEEQKQIDKTLNRGVEYVLRTLKNLGHPLDPTESNSLSDLITSGASPEQIIIRLRELTVNQAAHAADFRSIVELPGKIKSLNDQLTTLGKTKNPTEAQKIQISNIQGQYNQAVEDLRIAEQVKIDNPDDFAIYELLDKTFTLKDAAGQPTDIGQNLTALYKSKERYHELDSIIQEKNSVPDNKTRQSRTARLIEEGKLTDILDGIVPNALADTLEARYDTVFAVKSEALKKEQEKTLSGDEKRIEAKKGSRWIEYNEDDRSKKPHRENITNDMRTLAYQGEEGLKKLLLRELGWSYKKGEDTIEINDTNVLKMDLDADLNDEQKKRLNELYEKHGTKYREKLTTDFFLARSLGGKLKDRLPGTEKMGLKKHEWELFEKNFGGALNESMAQSKQFQGVVKRLEAAGIKPDFKTKSWLFALLAILGVGAVAGIGIAPLAVAAGGAAKVAGTTAWEGAL